MFTVLVALCIIVGIGCLLWRPQYAIVAVIVMFPLEQLLQSHFSIFVVHGTLINYIVGLVACTAVAWRFTRGEPVAMGYWSNMVVPMIWILYLLAWVGLLWSPDTALAMRMIVPGVPAYILTLVLLPLLIYDLESFYRVETGIMVVGAVIAALILLNPNSVYYGTRLMVSLGVITGGARANPLALADMGGAIAVIGATFVPRTKNPLSIAIRGGAIILGLGLAVASGSRGQVVGAILTSIIFYPMSRQLRDSKQFLILALGFMGMFAALSAVAQYFISDVNAARWDADSLSEGVDVRAELILTLFTAWLENPLAWVVGLGTNAFYSISSHGYVHNLVVEALCEHGLIGFGVLMVAMYGTFTSGRYLFSIYRDDPAMRSAAATLGALSVYWLLIALKQGSYLGSPQCFIFWFVLAKIAATERMLIESAEPEVADEEWSEAWEEEQASGGIQPVARAGGG